MNPSKIRFVNNVQFGPCAAVYYDASENELTEYFEDSEYFDTFRWGTEPHNIGFLVPICKVEEFIFDHCDDDFSDLNSLEYEYDIKGFYQYALITGDEVEEFFDLKISDEVACSINDSLNDSDIDEIQMLYTNLDDSFIDTHKHPLGVLRHLFSYNRNKNGFVFHNIKTEEYLALYDYSNGEAKEYYRTAMIKKARKKVYRNATV